MSSVKYTAAAAVLLMSASAYATECGDVSLPKGYEYSSLDECYFENGLAVVENQAGQFGFVDTQGNIKIAATFDQAWAFQEGFAVVLKGEKWGYIKPDGSYLVRPTYYDAWGFSEGRARFLKNGKYGFIDHTGKEVIAAKYDDGHPWFDAGVTSVKLNGKYALINRDGKLITPTKYAYIGVANEDRVRFSIIKDDEEYFGYLNTDGKEVIPAIYDYADSFSDGIAYVSKDNDEFYINRHGKRVEPKIDYDQP